MSIATIDPNTGKVEQSFQALNEAQLEEKLHLAEEAFVAFRRTTFAERAHWLRAAAKILERRQETYARLMAQEMGKLFKEGMAESVKCAWVCQYYAENGAQFLKEQPVQTDAGQSYVRFDPLGLVLAIMPWNFPFWQVFRFAAPCLMAGNVGLLKHASNVPQCALAIESVFQEAGFPRGVFQTLLLNNPQVEAVIKDPRLAAVTLTGSEGAGAQVAAAAGKVVKKTVLELGGSDPFIVMPSANLSDAVQTAVRARMVNSGQSCIAAKRFILAKPIAAEFQKEFVKQMERLKVGDPLQPDTQVGPLATGDILNHLHQQVEGSVQAGARLLCGGKPLPGPGCFYPPTVLTDIPRDCPAFREELFGPVACLFTVASADEAIRLANDSDFGLGASVWTNDLAERARFIAEIQAGMVFVNGMVASDPRLPFGGLKHSGYGRELGVFGIQEFVNIKSVWIK